MQILIASLALIWRFGFGCVGLPIRFLLIAARWTYRAVSCAISIFLWTILALVVWQCWSWCKNGHGTENSSVPTLFPYLKVDKRAQRRLAGFRMMDLPAEIRAEILTHCVDIPHPIDRTLFRKYRTKIAAIAGVSKQLRHEAEPLFYRRNRFRYEFDAYTMIPTEPFANTGNVYFPVEYRLSQKHISYPFPRRVRPMICHLELVLPAPNIYAAEPLVYLWLEPLMILEQDVFTGLELLKVSFRLERGFVENTWSRAQRLRVENAARGFVGALHISARTVDIDWSVLQ